MMKNYFPKNIIIKVKEFKTEIARNHKIMKHIPIWQHFQNTNLHARFN